MALLIERAEREVTHVLGLLAQMRAANSSPPGAEIARDRANAEARADRYQAIIRQIVDKLDGQEWDSDTPDLIANVLRREGYAIREPVPDSDAPDPDDGQTAGEWAGKI